LIQRKNLKQPIIAATEYWVEHPAYPNPSLSIFCRLTAD